MSNLAFATSKATAAFSKWQSQYAEVGIPTFPVDVEQKKPMVRGYEKIGIRASLELAQHPRFKEHEGFGFCGKRAGIVIVDIDAPGDSILADTLAEYGQTPIIVRTPSGGHHLWFRHSGEGRQIRPDASKPVDILGGGYVVAPPSRRGLTGYEMIQGRLEDVSSLPKCKRSPSGKLKYTDSIYNIPTLSPLLPPPAGNDDERVCEGARND